jgi:hypothetical protein
MKTGSAEQEEIVFEKRLKISSVWKLSRWDLKTDHIVPLARGGDSWPGSLRLLCRSHCSLKAERACLMEYMENKARCGCRSKFQRE